MQILVILAHPDPSSFNHAIAAEIRSILEKQEHTIWFHDLYKEKFDPILPSREISRDAELDGVISHHCNELTMADGIIIVHPNWWGQPPAILTGWVDRVVRPKIAYQFIGNDTGEGVPQGLLQAKSAIVINTSNTGEERETMVFGDPLERIWKDCIFGLCGVHDVHRITLRIIVTSTPEQRMKWLEEVRDLTRDVFPAA